MGRPPLSAEDFYELDLLSDPQVSPDNQWVAFVRRTVDRHENGYQSAIWLAPAGTCAQVAARPFTAGTHRDTSPRWSPDGRFLAVGYVNPAVLIACRVLTRRREFSIRDFLSRRVAEAVALRERSLEDPRFGRLVFSESDGLPGFVVDRYDDVLVVQSLTAGAARMEPELIEVLCESLKPRSRVADRACSTVKIGPISVTTCLSSSSPWLISYIVLRNCTQGKCRKG